jgi:methyltransferase-like protein
VQDKVLEICRNNVERNGISYVSYSAFPGAHFRLMARGLMLYHTRQFSDPAEKVQQSRGLLNFITTSHSPQRPADEPDAATEKPAAAYARRRNQVYRELLRNELEHLSRTPPAITFHDDLASFNAPVYFHEFAAHAARHGLQYLAEADFIDTQPPVPGAPTAMSPEATRVLDQLPPGDVVAREQYADFIKCRQFRQTLLCHADAPLARPATPGRVTTLYVSSSATPVSPSPDLRSTAPEEFQLPSKGTFKVNHPIAKAALSELGVAWPRRLHFDDLLARARRRVGGPSDADAGALAGFLLTGYAANILGLHAFAPPVAAEPGDRPLASALARAQAARRPLVSNLNGTTVDLSGVVPHRLLRLLDGTRDRPALAADLAHRCLREGAAPERDGRPVTDPHEVTTILRREMDQHLNTMARLALLVS